MSKRNASLMVFLVAAVVSFAAGAGADLAPMPTPTTVIPVPTTEFTTATLHCDSGIFYGSMKIVNTTAKEIRGTVEIVGDKNPAATYLVPVGQHRIIVFKSADKFGSCDVGLTGTKVKVSGAAFPMARTVTFKPHTANWLYTPTWPPSTTKTVYLKQLRTTKGFCGQPLVYGFEVRNTTTEDAQVPVNLKLPGYDKTVTTKIIVGNTGTVSHDTGVTLDCAGKGVPSVRFSMAAGIGAAATVAPYVIFNTN